MSVLFFKNHHIVNFMLCKMNRWLLGTWGFLFKTEKKKQKQPKPNKTHKAVLSISSHMEVLRWL